MSEKSYRDQRDFKVGDMVRYEVRTGHPYAPRWQHGSTFGDIKDHGGDGRYKHGKITQVFNDKNNPRAMMLVGRDVHWEIQQPSSLELIWDDDGESAFPWRHADGNDTQEKMKVVTSLKRQRVRSCDCGKERSNAPGPHYSWCDTQK